LIFECDARLAVESRATWRVVMARLWSLLASGLVCGVLWILELLGTFEVDVHCSLTLATLKLFEMPVLGFPGLSAVCSRMLGDVHICESLLEPIVRETTATRSLFGVVRILFGPMRR